MDDQTNDQTSSVLPKVPLTQETLDAVLKATEETAKPQTLDPYILFTQIEAMRKEGVEEATIREAFNQFMIDRSGTRPQVKNSMKRHPDSVPMPTQDEINKMYTDKLTEQKTIMSEDMNLIMDELENSKTRKAQAVVQSKRFSFKRFKDNLARRAMVMILRVTIFVFKGFGVK